MELGVRPLKYQDVHRCTVVKPDPSSRLDISDEFRRCLEALSKKSESKIRFVLNKAHQISPAGKVTESLPGLRTVLVHPVLEVLRS